MVDYSKRINYSIDNIERSIVADSEVGNMYSPTQKKKLYKEKQKLLNNFTELKKIIDIKHIHQYPIEGVRNFARIAAIPPEIVISDDRIKDMCQNQLWTSFVSQKTNKRIKRFTRCPGLETRSSCPYFTPPARKVRQLLNKADIFVVLQSKLFNEFGFVQWQFKTINRLREEIESILGKKSIIQQFGAGPCQACYPHHCLEHGKCRMPERQTPALEAMGIPVGQLCRDTAYLTGNKAWEIKWIKHFGLPNMTPKKWKVVFGLAVKLKNNKRIH
ncbi:MAG: hypothetical protein D6734_07265 [Candidatus Schekmanbacteria bacterium]|nr:MAG: hypothetical protein D6734_07265 [Candidatus Schekmanbacteria bacterium]